MSNFPRTMDEAITRTDAPVVFFPVRHHSPACARLVRELVRQLRPGKILIEGPSDYNSQLDELFLPHQLPLAIYSYFKLSDGRRRGAFYPFCEYSPEWQTLQVAHELGIPARFMDLPWTRLVGAASDHAEIPAQRYADGELRQGEYIKTLCERLGVPDFDTAWDTLFEIDPNLDLTEFMRRCHHFCFQLRATDPHIPAGDLRREAYMAAQIQQAIKEVAGQPVLVVTGGFHSHALFSRINGGSEAEELEETEVAVEEKGLALTPYSYERLDSLTGYESGMPHPGFYQQVWQDYFSNESGATHLHLLGKVVELLRRHGQTVSAADLIAVETMAEGLAGFRAHSRVWRTDLVDGIIGALVKEELEQGLRHPFLEAVYEALRGNKRGKLAPGVGLPPFVVDLESKLTHYDLLPDREVAEVRLDLTNPEKLECSQFLHQIRLLQIPGYQLTDGSDFVGRGDLSTAWEEWTVRWSPEYEAGRIEAAIYGAAVREAATAKLLERAGQLSPPNAEQGAILLLEASLMGLQEAARDFYGRLVALVRQDGSFASVGAALDHLLYLFHYDEVLHTGGSPEIGGLLTEAWGRGLWLMEGLGQSEGQDRKLLAGVRSLLETFERAGAKLSLAEDQFGAVAERVAVAAVGPGPLLRGAATGVLWLLGRADTARVGRILRYFADPDHLGDFLTGLFFLAREVVQRSPELASSLDEMLEGFDDEEFLGALPALRLAFAYFSPREKDYLARTILKAFNAGEIVPLPDLEVSLESATAALAFEARLFKAVEKYGLYRPSAWPAKQGNNG